MVLGCYYLTANNPTEQTTADQYFYSFDDVINAYKQSILNLHTFVWVRITDEDENLLKPYTNSKFIKKNFNDKILYLSPELQLKTNLKGDVTQKYIKTTPGRILLNQSFQ